MEEGRKGGRDGKKEGREGDREREETEGEGHCSSAHLPEAPGEGLHCPGLLPGSLVRQLLHRISHQHLRRPWQRGRVSSENQRKDISFYMYMYMYLYMHMHMYMYMHMHMYMYMCLSILPGLLPP